MIKTSKIRGVDKNICTGEQMIAYNYSQAYYHSAESAGVAWAINFIKKCVMGNEQLQKYNVNLVCEIVEKNFENYLNNAKYKILSSYDDIGAYFPL